MMAMDSQALVKLGGSGIPETLGNFRLDDHNVVEWSDSDLPGVRHKGRKETGKWINPNNNADIQYQKQEDCKKSDRGEEQVRTEVIQGQAPDSQFQIVRSHSHFHTENDNLNSSLVQSSSTSYQMSSSRGVRSTSKSTSNRTTTKTVTVSGGRSDDFEHLGLTFQPLDTSTQRERINVSRSGTMGVRRPPTRRHTPVTPAPIVSTSPDDSEVEIKDEIIVDSDDNLRNTPPPPTRSSVMMNHASSASGSHGLSIVEFKDITPKFRGVMVGFPVEIQLELQSRLRGSASHNMDRRNGMDSDDDDVVEVRVRREDEDKSSPYQHSIKNDTAKRDSSPARQFGLSTSSEKKGSTFDFHQRKKSYELESFDSHADSSRLLSSNNNNSNKFASNYLNLFPPSDDDDNHHHHHRHHHHHGSTEDNVTTEEILMDQQLRRHNSPSPIIQSPSPPPWTNFYDKLKPTQGNERSKMFENSVNNNPFMSYDENTFEKSTPIPIQIEGRGGHRKNDAEFESDKYFGQDNYMVTPSKLNFSAKSTLGQSGETYDTREEEQPSPQQPLSPSPPLLSPSLERSRRLLQMLHETPTVMSKMAGGKYSHSEEDSNERKWGHNNNNENEEEEWQTQRQLSFLNDSLSRILEAGRTSMTTAPRKSDQGQEKYSNMVENVYTFSNQKYSSRECEEDDDDENDEMDINGNLRPTNPAQVSQTWISSADMNKPSQKVRDKDVTTSISATHDHFRRGAKKVEFCKTEVHFTADSGKFHIVETDENKPSTSHLFRRKKKDRTKSGESEIATTPTTQTSAESISTPLSSSSSSLSQKSGEILRSDEKNQKHWLFGKDYNDKRTSSVAEPLVEQLAPSSTSSSHPKNDTQSNKPLLLYDDFKSSEPTATLDESYILELQPRVSKSRLMPTSDNTESPSHNIFSNYEELKIQRYLSRLKSPPSQQQHQSDSHQAFNFDLNDQNQPNTYRFNNVLYENGSFVPLATRRSLIEMNNTNKKGGRDMSESDNRSSVSITPENPVATQPIARMEARVATGRPNPQITSVELRYDFDNDRVRRNHRNDLAERSPSPPPFHSYHAPPPLHEREDKKKKQFSDHSRHVKKEEEQTTSHHQSSEPSYSSRSERISDLIKRSYYKNPDLEWNPNDSNNNNINKRLNTLANNNLAMSAATISSTSNNKSASKSIVTIGDYDMNNTLVGGTNSTPALVNADPSPEPILSMDHTWKGPAYSNADENSSDRKSNARSLTLLKLGHHSEQPEWISKARNREHRILDWESVGKQPTYSSTPSQPPEQPPWVDDFIRPRAKTVLADRIVPKVSVVYPWQRHPVPSSLSRNESRSDDGRMEDEEEDGMKSHIVSIVPTPSFITSKYNRKLEPIGGRSGPTSLPDLPVLQLSNKEEVVDRDSDSILVHSSTQVMKNRASGGGKISKGGGRGTKETERSLPPPPPPPSATLSSSRSSNPNKLITSETESEQRPTTRNSVKSGIHATTISKMAKVASNNKVSLNDPVTSTTVSGGGGRKSGSGRGRMDVKSSVTSGDTTTTRSNKAVDKQSTTTTTSSATPIHRHPLVKVSKLPVRKNLPKSSSGEGKGMKGSSKGGSKENPDESSTPKKKSGHQRVGLLSPTNTPTETVGKTSLTTTTTTSNNQPWRRK